MIENKIEIIKKINNYDSKFLLKVINSNKNRKKNIEKLKNNSKIIIKNNSKKILNNKKNIIDLDEIWADKYLYTRMRIRFDNIVKNIEKININKLEKNPKKIIKKIILKKTGKCSSKNKEKIDIIDFIKNIEINNLKNNNYVFISEKIDEESLFKEEQINKAIEILECEDEKMKYSKIYDEVCEYLNKDFISNQYCDFENNKCIAQRKHQFYPINKTNGCCYKMMNGCHNLVDGKCRVECIACKLFACEYLRKRGVGYWGDEIVLFKAFLTVKQRRHFIFDFYESKEQILNKI